MMSKVVKFAKTIREHWKKSIAFVFLTGYGVKFLNGRYEQDLLRRQYCIEAQKYGNVKVKLGDKIRKITVFLNPAASNGKASKLFQKNAAPLFHLAGLEVNLVRTEYEGQVKKFLEVLDKKDTDGIVVAGGDGTLLEAITGVMRKDDKEFTNKIPIGVIPLGKTNRFAKVLFGPDKEQVRFILDSALAVVDGFSKRMDVLKYESEDGNKSTFSMMGLTVGAYNDAEIRKKKYWYFGPLKSRWTYIRTSLMEWPPLVKGKLSYILATEENTKMKRVVVKPPEREVKRSWWNILHLLYKPQHKNDGVVEEVEVEDSDQEEITEDVSAVELSIRSPVINDNNQDIISAELEIGPSDIKKTNFINEGWRRIGVDFLKHDEQNNRKLFVKKLKFIPDLPESTPENEDKKLLFTIDGEQYEAMPVEIRLLRNRISVFQNNRTIAS